MCLWTVWGNWKFGELVESLARWSITSGTFGKAKVLSPAHLSPHLRTIVPSHKITLICPVEPWLQGLNVQACAHQLNTARLLADQMMVILAEWIYRVFQSISSQVFWRTGKTRRLWEILHSFIHSFIQKWSFRIKMIGLATAVTALIATDKEHVSTQPFLVSLPFLPLTATFFFLSSRSYLRFLAQFSIMVCCKFTRAMLLQRNPFWKFLTTG